MSSTSDGIASRRRSRTSRTSPELAGRCWPGAARASAPTLIDAVLAGLAFGLLALVTPINVFKPTVDRSSSLWMLMVQNLVLGFVLFLVVHGYLLADARPDRRQGAAEDPHRPQRRLAGVVRAGSSACAT